MEWGDKEEFLLSIEESGGSAPALDRKVSLPSWASYYVDAFHVLSGRRVWSDGLAMPIAMSEMVSYLTLYPWYDVDEFVRMIQSMDSAYMDCVNGKKEELT